RHGRGRRHEHPALVGERRPELRDPHRHDGDDDAPVLRAELVASAEPRGDVVGQPSQPSDLRPSEAATSLAKPHLTFTYEDLGGNTALAAVQVQISATSSFSSPLFDSGT